MTLKAQLEQLERYLLLPDLRADGERMKQLLAPEFVEVGASGERWDRDALIEALLTEPPMERSLHDFQLQQLAPDVALLTYRACRSAVNAAGVVLANAPPVESWRSSIWQQRAGHWVLIFHQGTLLPV